MVISRDLTLLSQNIHKIRCRKYRVRYRSWNLGHQADGTAVRLVCRTEHDGVTLGPNGETQTLTIKAFNEWDSRVWLLI